MLRHCSWLLWSTMCVACVGAEENSGEVLGRTEQAVFNGTLSVQANSPAINRVTSGVCSSILISPRLALTAQHCKNLMPVTDSTGSKKYSELVHPQSPLWDGATHPRVTWVWAPSGWVEPERKRDIQIIAFEDTEAPLSVFPQRIRYFDSRPVNTNVYDTNVSYALPVVFMGWGDTETHHRYKLYEQRFYTFGNELPLTSTGDGYRSWTANLGPYQYYHGPGVGDSGGPLLRQLSADEPSEFELIGLNSGLDGNSKNEDPRYTDEELAAMSPSERAAALADSITYHWPDVTASTFLQQLYYAAGDLSRPGRLYGERDYYGPERRDLDPDGDHYYGSFGASCPMYLYDQRGAYGELTQQGGVDYAPNLGTALPALHAYRSLRLNDRTRVYDRNRGWGTVVLGSHEARLIDGWLIDGRFGTDVNVGKLYAEGGGTLALSDRSKVRSAWWSGINLSVASGSEVSNSPEASTMRIPQSRLSTVFPWRPYGVVPTGITSIPGASSWNGSCSSNAFCHVFQSIEPNKTVTLAPGYYGDVALKSNSKIILSGGDYYFDGLSTESSSYLVVASGSSARLWVRDTMTLRNYGNITRVIDPATGLPKVSDVSAAANLFIGYYGLREASVWELSATLVAPYAKVTLETNRDWATAHAGMVIANRIELHQGNSFYHVPYLCR